MLLKEHSMRYGILISCLVASLSATFDKKDDYWLHNFGDVTCFGDDDHCEEYAAPICSTTMWISAVNFKKMKAKRCILYTKDRYICNLPDKFLSKLKDKHLKQLTSKHGKREH